MPIIREVTMTMLEVWQAHYGYSDRQAAERLALPLGEFLRQRGTKPSRQTCLIAILITMYQPDMAAIAKAAAELGRPPARSSEDAHQVSTPTISEGTPDLTSDWS
jgi:hypothetical protein